MLVEGPQAGAFTAAQDQAFPCPAFKLLSTYVNERLTSFAVLNKFFPESARLPARARFAFRPGMW
jgi:hypothetical protein